MCVLYSVRCGVIRLGPPVPVVTSVRRCQSGEAGRSLGREVAGRRRGGLHHGATDVEDDGSQRAVAFFGSRNFVRGVFEKGRCELAAQEQIGNIPNCNMAICCE